MDERQSVLGHGTEATMAGSKVVVTDHTFGELDIEKKILEPLGCTIAAAQCRTVDEVMQCAADADFVITQFAPVTGRAIQAMQKAQIIVRYGIGVDNVDLAVAKQRGIPVCNVPDYCIDEVADHTLAMMLAVTRQIACVSSAIHAGKWGAGLSIEAYRTLKYMTTGIVGCGRIGREVIHRLAAFKPPVLAYDPLLTGEAAAALGCKRVSLEELFSSSDIISLHCPSTAETQKMVNAQTLASMKDGAILINMGRGTLVDTPALIAALQSGKLSGAALDVTDPEPLTADSPLRFMDNVVITNHIASASVQSGVALRNSVALTVAKAVRGERLTNCINGVV
jgi:D-3-phosphoglycerate dehydrogenase